MVLVRKNRTSEIESFEKCLKMSKCNNFYNSGRRETNEVSFFWLKKDLSDELCHFNLGRVALAE